MSNKSNNSVETIIEGSPAKTHILSFLVPEAILHTYYLNEFSFKEDIPLNIAKTVVNDVWEDKQSLICIYEDNDKTSVSYFMVRHDDKDSFEMQYGNFNEFYNQPLYSSIKGKSKETLEDYMYELLSDLYIDPPKTENDEEGIKNMIPIEELEIDNEHVKYDVMNHIHSFFDDKYSIYQLDMLKYADNRVKSKIILDKYIMYQDIEDCIKTKKAVIITIPNDMAGIEYTYILGKYYNNLFHMEIGLYNRFMSCSIPRYRITTGKVSKDIDFVTEIDVAVLNYNTFVSLPALNE